MHRYKAVLHGDAGLILYIPGHSTQQEDLAVLEKALRRNTQSLARAVKVPEELIQKCVAPSGSVNNLVIIESNLLMAGMYIDNAKKEDHP